MMSLRAIRRRIRSVSNTQKITRAMEMVAAAKLRRFLDLLEKTRPYADQIRRMLGRLLGDQPSLHHPLLEERRNGKKSAWIILASDSGLCGTYNSNVFEAAQEAMKKEKGRVPGEEPSFEVIPVGRMAVSFFRKRPWRIASHFLEIRPANTLEIAGKIAELAKELFLSRQIDSVFLAYTQFRSLSSYRATVERFLPIPPPEIVKPAGSPILYILEPNGERILEALIPQFLFSEFKRKMLESLVSEQVARMLAMRQATDNAEKMIEELTLLRNKVRQASITKEIIEVVTGARSLRR